MKVTITGLGNVGSTLLFGLLDTLPSHTDINIVEKDERKKGVFLDLQHAYISRLSHQLFWNNENEFEEADFIFHTAGGANVTNGDRDSVLAESQSILIDIFQGKSFSNNPYIIVIANPVDIISYILYSLVDLPSERIISTGTLLDSLRLEYLLCCALNCKAEKINAFCIGEHGKTVVPVWSQCEYNGTELMLDDSLRDHYLIETKRAAFDIVADQGCTKYGVAQCAKMIFNALYWGKTLYYPVGRIIQNKTLLEKLRIENDISLSVPCILSKNFIQETQLNISENEWHQLAISAQKIEATIQKLNFAHSTS